MDLALVALAGTAGAVAGRGAHTVLRRLPAPVRAPPLICEAAVAAVWTLLAWRAAYQALPLWWVPVPAALVWLAVVLVATDVRHRLLPNVVTLPAYPVAAGLVAVAAVSGPGPPLAVRAAVGGLVLLVGYAAVHVAAPTALGAGDVKLAGVVGAVLGAVSWPALLLGQLIAAAVTAVVAGVLAFGGRGTAAPHGPGMLLAASLVTAFPPTSEVVFPVA